jgi:hypothetical protein
LRDYIRYNGTYSVDTLLRAAYKAAGNPQDGVAWLLDVAQAAPEPVSMYTMIAQANWIPPSAREPIYLRLIDQLKSTVHSSQSLAQEYAVGDLRQWQVRYARYLASMKQYERAMAVLDSLPKQAAIAPNELEIRYRVALASGKFDSILEHYRTVPDDAPAIATVRIAALALQAADEKAAARKLMEYVYEQEIASHQLTASNLLGLAQIKLENNDLPGAMEQLRRVTLVVGEPYENLDAAADVLAKNRRHAEAAEFLAQLAKATPWDSSARVKLAREEIAAARDESAARTVAAEVARSERAKYAERLQAAELAGARQTLGSAELEQIASGAAVADAADKPFFYTAPIRAAQHASGADRSRLLSNTVKEYPNRDDGRVPLFAVLQAAGKQQLALSAIEPLMNTDYFSRGRGALPVVELETPTPRDVRDAVQADSSDYVPDYVGREYVRQYDETASVRAQDELNDRALRERAGLATQVAKAYVAIDDPRKAITYERTALAYLVKAAAPTTEKAVVAQRALANRNIRRLLAGIERDAQNRTRMPVIHSGLEQANIVRPKLGARAPATPKSMGGAQ